MLRHQPIPGNKESILFHRYVDVSFSLLLAALLLAAYKIGGAEDKLTASVTMVAPSLIPTLLYLHVKEMAERLDRKIRADQGPEKAAAGGPNSAP